MIIIVKSMNETPERKVQERLEKLRRQGVKFKIVAATTSVSPYGEMVWEKVTMARHTYFVTTVILDIDEETRKNIPDEET